jgi:predicted AAA+ superfamily ATPase
MLYLRSVFSILVKRLREPRRFIQVLAGPRQTGKTTLAQQVMTEIGGSAHYASADEPLLKDRVWIQQQWETARVMSVQRRRAPALLVLDEVQKIPGWPDTVKHLWDQDSATALPLRVLLLGSSPLLLQRGLAESLAGRFEIIPATHWSFTEMRDGFGWDIERYIFFGGYPGAVPLVEDRLRWASYIVDSLIETTVSRDILLMTRVDKPALLRRLFELGCAYSGRILSYQKMLGQLQDAGNTTTLSHYLKLLEGAGLLMGIPKYSGQRVRQRGSSPKFLVLNTALMTAPPRLSLEEAKSDSSLWGRLVETAVGAWLANGIQGKGVELSYWSCGNREVDFVLNRGKKLIAIEVKTGAAKSNLPGMAAFSKEFERARTLLVGPQGIGLEAFLTTPPEEWVE